MYIQLFTNADSGLHREILLIVDSYTHYEVQDGKGLRDLSKWGVVKHLNTRRCFQNGHRRPLGDGPGVY